jgi:tetratricopeptide (TPR) repeat protein
VLEVEPLDEPAAVELFAERARRADARFVLDERTEDDVRAVCRRVDGLPLAIEIVAARVVSVSVQDMAEGLGFGLATTGASDAPDRHRTLEAAIEWGAGILDERLRALHASLGAFQSRFTPEAAAFAFGATFDDLDALVRSALLRRVDEGGPTRLAMLQTVREFARDRLAADARSEEARARRAAWIEELAARAAPSLDAEDPGPWLVELEQWAPDIRATLREAVHRGDHARCIRITSSLERFWRARGEVGEARTILAGALAASPPDDPAARARASWTLARLAAAQGDARGAQGPLREALSLYQAGGFARETAFALTELAWGALDLGELPEAEARAEEALAVARAAADARATSSALSARATIASERGDRSTARACAEESLAIRRRLGDRQLVANAALTLGSAALAEGDLDGAQTALEECLELAVAMGDVLHAAGARCCLGEIAALRGEHDAAAEQLLPALAAFVRLGNDAAAAECLVALAATRGDDTGAARLLGAAAAARERLGVAPVPTERRLEQRIRRRLRDASVDDRAGRDLSLVEAALLAGVDPGGI